MKIDKTIKKDLKKVFQREMSERKKKVVLFSPYKLNKMELSDLRRNFPQIKDSRLINQIDKSLLAGFVIKYGTKMIDLSIKSRLNKIFSEIR